MYNFDMNDDEPDTIKHLPEITKRIVEISDPDQIILFGSYARGDFGPDSDLDLLISKEQVSSPREEAERIYRALANMLISVDVVVVSKAYVQRYKDIIGTVVRPALREGRVIYARLTPTIQEKTVNPGKEVYVGERLLSDPPPEERKRLVAAAAVLIRYLLDHFQADQSKEVERLTSA
jgi:predicted nucleotidyltransferase